MNINIKRIYRTNQELVLYSGLFLVGLISLVVGLIPAIQKSIVLIKDVQTMQDEVNRIQKKVNLLVSLNQQTLEQNSQDTLAAVPTDKSVSSLMSTIEAVAAKNNLYISDMSIEGISTLSKGGEKPVTKPEGNTLTESLTLQGELVQLRNFLTECVKVRRLMRVKTIMLTSMPKSRGVTANLVIEMYYLPLPTTIGKSTDSLEGYSQKEQATLEKISSYPIMFPMETQPTTSQTTIPAVEVPTVPVVMDPFSGSEKIVFPTATPIPSPRPMVSPVASPTATKKITPTPIR